MSFAEGIQIEDFLIIEDVLPIMVNSTGISVYDFNFRMYFKSKSIFGEVKSPVIARVGAPNDYQKFYNELKDSNIELVHTPEEHERCSLLPIWFPIIKDLTPKSVIYDELPSSKTVEKDLGWPVFIKGERQTSKHKKSISIIHNQNQFENAIAYWKNDSILRWQRMVCREYVELQMVEDPMPDRIPSSFEFRLFFWKQQLVGLGRYWYEGINYELSREEELEVKTLGHEVAKRIQVNFLVVDIAKTAKGQWIVIEVNDGQESGYAGVSPILMWQKIIDIEKNEGCNRLKQTL